MAVPPAVAVSSITGSGRVTVLLPGQGRCGQEMQQLLLGRAGGMLPKHSIVNYLYKWVDFEVF